MKGNQEGKIQKGKCFKENKCIHHNTQININNKWTHYIVITIIPITYNFLKSFFFFFYQ